MVAERRSFFTRPILSKTLVNRTAGIWTAAAVAEPYDPRNLKQ